MATLASTRSASPFNSPLEAGLRAVQILNAAFPAVVDLVRLTWLDHLVVHTGDVGGPRSLHPSLPQRNGELLVRRRLLEESLQLMRRLHLVDAVADENGIGYRASEDANAFVNLMQTDYSASLRECAEWVVSMIGVDDPAAAAKARNPHIDEWVVALQAVESPAGTAG